MLYSPILDRQALLPLFQMNSVLRSVGTDAALSLTRFAASFQWFRSAAIAPNVLRSRLQTTLKRRLGLPAGLVPMVSSLYSMSLGIRGLHGEASAAVSE